MKRIDTAIAGVCLLEPKIFGDDRGYFYETYNAETLSALGIDVRFVQDNESFSRRGVIRGLHFQKGEHAQAKLVRVIEGEVLDVALDLRAGSPTFGKYVSVRLTGENRLQFFIPRGFAHGFAVLSPTARFVYKCDNFYAPASEGSVHALDPGLAIDWTISDSERLFSPKDLKAPSFADYVRNPAFHYNA